ncbi:MAG TPA: Fur family transcriptional regulator [Gaiellaceae bacterium]|nr:Fur family transcriptional regulator [Gaiellaceae bacterium]
MAAATWSEHAGEELRRAGFRSGGARRAVVDFLGRRDCCVSAQELHDGLRGEGRAVGIATVYRVLEQLVGLRLVHRVELGEGVARFEPALPGGEHHHHLVCDDCGRVEPFSDPALERALSRVAGTRGYDLDAHDVVLRGACADCR